MTIKGVLFRFVALYMATVIVVGLVINYLGMAGGSGINVAILAGCVMYVCNAFGEANKRYFTSSEKTAVVIGLIVIDVGLQLLFGYVAISINFPGYDFLVSLLISVAIVGTIHAVVIYFFVGIARKLLVKQGTIEG